MKKFICFILACLILTICVGVAFEKSTVKVNSAGKQGWGFKKIEGRSPQFTKEQIETMEKYSCIYLGNDEKNVYLTFDEGYENGYTKQILDTLRKHAVPAAFFITADYFEKNGDLVDIMVNDGHIVGNHTVNHPSLPTLSQNDIKKEINGLSDRFLGKYGKNMKYLRPPMGEYSEKTLEITQKMGYTNVFWSFAYKDWEIAKQAGKEHTLNQIKKYLHGGCVILLHAVSKDNADAMEEIITYVRQMGYEFKTLDEYK